MNPVDQDAWVAEDPTLCAVCGRESCEEHLPPPAPDSSPTAPTAPSITFTSASAVMATPRPIEIIDGIAWAGCLTVLVSESGTGKTFLLLDAAAAVSAGLKWHGRDTRQGSVAYLSYEGDALGVRLRALHDQGGHLLEHVYILRAHDPLSPRVTRDGEERSMGELAAVAALTVLARELDARRRPPIHLLVIDTVRASLAGSEDSSEHVAAYLRAVRRIAAQVPTAAIILAHHAGWQDGDTQRKRERGSSAWRGNCDATLYLEAGRYDADRGEAELTLKALKVRDAERPAPLHLVRRRVDLNESNGHGEPVTSCVIASDQRSRADREAEAAALIEQQQRAADLQTLRVVVDHPEATSQDRLRQILNVQKVAVSDSLSRLLNHGWMRLPARQRQPYIVTEAGVKALERGA